MDLSPKAKEAKATTNRWNPIKHKSFCIAKENINKTKKVLNDKMFADTTNKELISRTYKQLVQCNIKITNNLILKMS